MEKKPASPKPKGEYIFLGVLFVLALLAFPAFRDVQGIQSLVIGICAGLGIK